MDLIVDIFNNQDKANAKDRTSEIIQRKEIRVWFEIKEKTEKCEKASVNRPGI